MNVLGPEPEDDTRPWTTCRWWRGLPTTTDLMAGTRVVTSMTVVLTAMSSTGPPSDPSQRTPHAHVTPLDEDAAHTC